MVDFVCSGEWIDHLQNFQARINEQQERLLMARMRNGPSLEELAFYQPVSTRISKSCFTTAIAYCTENAERIIKMFARTKNYEMRRYKENDRSISQGNKRVLVERTSEFGPLLALDLVRTDQEEALKRMAKRALHQDVEFVIGRATPGVDGKTGTIFFGFCG